MDFGKILKRAWEIIWKFKVLWLFGILASCGQNGSGTSTGSGGGGGNSGFQTDGQAFNLPPAMKRFFFQTDHFFDNIEIWQMAATIGGLIFFFLILGLIMTALSTIGRIGIIQGAVQAEQGIERLTFGDLFTSGKSFFWRVFGLNFLVGFVIFIIVLVLLVPAIGFTILTIGLGALCLIPLICVIIPLSWLISIIIGQANIALVVEDLDIMAAIQRGWIIFRENIVNLVIMGLILGVGGFIVGIVIALPIIIIVFPAAVAIVGGAMAESNALLGGGLAVAGLCFVAYLPVLIVLGGILRSYVNTAWTLTYLQITAESPLESDDSSILVETVDEI